MLSSRRSLECSRPTNAKLLHMNPRTLEAAVNSAARPGVTPVHRGSDATSDQGPFLGLEATTKDSGIRAVGVMILSQVVG